MATVRVGTQENEKRAGGAVRGGNAAANDGYWRKVLRARTVHAGGGDFVRVDARRMGSTHFQMKTHATGVETAKLSRQ